jgi:formylglycine-generating enzyme required for sulfatase activity
MMLTRLFCLFGRHDFDRSCTCRRCLIKHDWDGCRCTHCLTRRDAEHHWEAYKKCLSRCTTCHVVKEGREPHDWSENCEKCRECDTFRATPHVWDGCKCKNCPQTRDVDHSWDLVTCRRCGTVDKVRPFEKAINAKDSVLVEKLLIAGVDPNTQFGWPGAALLTAILKDDLTIVTCLVNHGARTDIRGSNGGTPLHYAAECSRNGDVLLYLINQGLDISLTDSKGNLAIKYATGGNIYYLASKGSPLKEPVDSFTALHRAVAEDRLHDAIMLVKHGADVLATDRNGKTPWDVLVSQERRTWTRLDQELHELFRNKTRDVWPREALELSATERIDFVSVPAGMFDMGSDEYNVLRTVELTRSFQMARDQVTQGQWKAVIGNNPSYFADAPTCPVEQVSWNDVQVFIDELNTRADGFEYGLPTEAEWEYACRAITKTEYYWGNEWNPRYGWCLNQSDPEDRHRTVPVGSFKPNRWGLFDMLGNVWEWCGDWYGLYEKCEMALKDPKGAPDGKEKVIRGGGWNTFASDCKSHARSNVSPDSRDGHIGFRVLRRRLQ